MSTLKEILAGNASSLIPQLHLEQIALFLFRKGIELYPEVDDDTNSRLHILTALWEENRSSLYLRDMWEKGAVTGGILLYVRPNGKSYRVSYYDQNCFKVYYNPDGDPITVILETEYLIEGEDGKEVTRYNRLRMSDRLIEKWDSDRHIDKTSPPDQVTKNPYGFLPCVIINNKEGGIGRKGIGEFEKFAGVIEKHNWMREQVEGNLEFFGGPIFYSSRSRAEMIEAGMIEDRYSIASQFGYGKHVATRERIKARRIFDNLEEGEQIGFATPEAIANHTVDFINDCAKQIRAALGGIDESEYLKSEGSSFEMKTILAGVTNTANHKAETYITHGIAAAYSLMLQMAEIDKKISTISPDKTIRWRHLGEVYQDTATDTLTKSIICRNLLRLGVNIKDCIKFLFPERREEEIQKMLESGFAYEFLNGIAGVSRNLKDAQNEQGQYAIDIEDYLRNVMYGRSKEPRNNYEQSGFGNYTDRDRGELVQKNDRENDVSKRKGTGNGEQGTGRERVRRGKQTEERSRRTEGVS